MFEGKKIGNEKDFAQESINSHVDQRKIEELLCKNFSFLEKLFSSSKDKYEISLLKNLKEFNKINFSLNKHEEIFCNAHISNYKKIFNYLVFRFKFRSSGKEKLFFKVPLYLLVEPVSACNLKCPFCFQSDKTFTTKPFMGIMNFELYKNIIDEADKIGVRAITLASRGEPTMHKNFVEMVEYLRNKKNIYEFKINTNASRLTEKLCHAILSSGVTQIVISSDHYIKEHYERLRVGAIFEKIVQNVDMLYNIRKNFYKDSITEIRISGVDNDKNLDRKKFHDFWIKRSDQVSASFPIERYNTYLNNKHPNINDPCEKLWDRMYIWHDGVVNPCDADYKSYLSYGNIKNNSISNIWNGEAINKLRKAHLAGDRKKINPCDRCGVAFD